MNSAISILIRTLNSAGTLEAVLARLDLQPEDELIVVDSGSTDTTLAIAEKYHARIVTAPPPFNYSKSLNLGFQVAKNPWVLVISSHCLPLTADLLGTFRAAVVTVPEEVAVVYGVCSLVDDPKTADLPAALAGGDSDLVQRQRVYGGNGLALYRRTWWERLGFDETLPTAEDLAWFTRALNLGAKAARVPAARVLYRNQGSLRHMFRKGWLESRMAQKITPGSGMSLRQLGVNWGALLKKWATGRIPTDTLLRQGAHGLGAYLLHKRNFLYKGNGKGNIP